MIPPFAISALIILGTLGTVCFALVLIRWCVEILSGNGRFHAVQQVATSLLLSASLAQIPAMIPWMTKGNLFDRYLLAFLPGLLIFLASKIKNYNFTTNLSILLILIIWFIGFAMASEYAAHTRARAALLNTCLPGESPGGRSTGGTSSAEDTQLLNAGQLYHPPGSRENTHITPQKRFPRWMRSSASPRPRTPILAPSVPIRWPQRCIEASCLLRTGRCIFIKLSETEFLTSRITAAPDNGGRPGPGVES